MNSIISLWKFARPHTIIGTITSVSALFIIATSQYVSWPRAFWISLISAVTCNVFITGYNQLVDVKLDEINKPYLPLASGEMTILTGKKIVWSALIISLSTAYFLSTFFFALVLLIAAIGFLYSWKAVYLKRQHRLAAIAITLVRGFLINAGFYLYYSGHNADIGAITNPLWLLIIFVALFSLGISWFKDIPDVVGDKTEKVASLAITIGSKRAFNYGVLVVALGYTLAAFAPIFVNMNGLNLGILTIGNAIAGFIFLGMASRVKPENQESIKRFYLTFWGLFVVEYLIFAIAAI
ncbi:homogentisate phytyltransferase [Cryomorpha ignava]|uniref:Homogentisate phytyltransferase n=1 Tax=Cryomorpha ignava TaxID=101383 RepID=A0A7K3WKG3_9FLAO|nr:homogentisate phytyltransferase [Cryomorpha ignava]NEN21984.1 homogentisate phytyltransferase [Cryomorpha ignava]